jgi:hypothetical protein
MNRIEVEDEPWVNKFPDELEISTDHVIPDGRPDW